MIATLLLAVAHGQDCGRAFTEFEVRTMVRESSEAVDRDDALTHKRLWSELLARVPCLDAQLPKDAWATFLINEAIVRNATREPDWEGPLATALQILPDQSNVPDFLIQQFSPPPPPRSSGVEVPADAALFVDGVLLREVPVLQGEHVVQLWRDRRWRSALVIGTTPPADWLAPRAAEVVEVEVASTEWAPTSRGAAGLLLGFGLSNQLVDDPGTFLADSEQYSGMIGFATHGVAPLAAPGGVFWDLVLPAAAPNVRTNAVTGGFAFEPSPTLFPVLHGGAALVLEELHVGAGAGVIRVQKVEGNERVALWLPQPHLTLGVVKARGDFEVGGGATPTAAHVLTRGGWLLSEPRALSWRLGFDAHLGSAFFVEEAPGDRRATVLQVSLLARIDAAWGRAPGGRAL